MTWAGCQYQGAQCKGNRVEKVTVPLGMATSLWKCTRVWAGFLVWPVPANAYCWKWRKVQKFGEWFNNNNSNFFVQIRFKNSFWCQKLQKQFLECKNIFCDGSAPWGPSKTVLPTDFTKRTQGYKHKRFCSTIWILRGTGHFCTLVHWTSPWQIPGYPWNSTWHMVVHNCLTIGLLVTNGAWR